MADAVQTQTHLQSALDEIKAAGGSPIAQELLQFVISVVSGVPDTITYKLPAVKETQVAKFFGRTYTFVEELNGDTLTISETPS